MMDLTLPLKLDGSLNSRELWQARSRRVAKERAVVCGYFLAQRFDLWRLRAINPGGRWVVQLTRIAPRKLDSDNLLGRFKGVRDEVAKQLLVDDGSERIRFDYAQRKGKPREHVVRVTIFTEAEFKLRQQQIQAFNAGLIRGDL